MTLMIIQMGFFSRKTPNKGKEFSDRSSISQDSGLEVPLVSTTKQRRGLLAQTTKQSSLVYEKAGYRVGGLEEGRAQPQVSGGGSIETGGDGTGRAGGVDLNYWERWLNNFAEWKRITNMANPVEGVDYPTAEQMEKARAFHRQRENF